MSQSPQQSPSDQRWNFVAFLVDYVCFGVAFTFIDVNAVMPDFVRQLTASAPLIGLVSTVFNGSWMLPQLAVARHINDKPLKKPYLIAGMSGRIFILLIALALWLGLAHSPAVMLTLFFVSLGLFAASDGLASVAWFDLLARAVPLKRRGRLIGIAQFSVGVAGIGVGALVGLILKQCAFFTNYALLFTLAGVTLIPSAIALSLIREPPPDESPHEASGQALSEWFKLLGGDPAFLRLMACRMLVGMLGLVTPFYVVHASTVLHLPRSVIGNFVVAQTVSGMTASIVLGFVSERWGPRYVVRIGSAAAALGPLFALAAHLAGAGWLVWAYPFVYVMLGVVNSAWMQGFFNYLLELAPPGMRPAYIGLGNTVMGGLTLVPMAGGWLLEATSYSVLFGVAAFLVTLGFVFTLGLGPPWYNRLAGEQV